MDIQAYKTRIFQEKEPIASFVLEHIDHLEEKDILVVTSKIVSLSEGRTAACNTREEKEQLIKDESQVAVPTKHVWLTIKDGMLMATAGIDQSNAHEQCILLPKDSYEAAKSIRHAVQEHTDIKELGVIITDSQTKPLRAGTTGVALGYAGFQGLKDYRGTRDIYGRELQFSTVSVADNLAAGAVLLMGEGDEQQPLAIIKDAPVTFMDQIDRNELRIDLEDDMYRPLFEGIL